MSSESVAEGVIDNAISDLRNPSRFKLIAKNLLAEHYRVKKLDAVPEFTIEICETSIEDTNETIDKSKISFLGEDSTDGYKMYRIEYSEEFNTLSAGQDPKRAAMYSHSPIVCAGLSNLYIKAAQTLNADLYLPKPISGIIGNKLFESAITEIDRQRLDVQDVIDTLQLKVDFPDLRQYVNSSHFKLNQIIELREKVPDFRKWIQKEEKDFDEIVEIHNDTGLRLNLGEDMKKESFAFFGIFDFHTDLYPEELALTDGSNRFLQSVGQQLLDEWKPLSLGYWLKNEIYSELNKNRKAFGK